MGWWIPHPSLVTALLLVLVVLECCNGQPPAAAAANAHNNLEKNLSPVRMDCNAKYSTPCARVNSEWLAKKTASDIAAALTGDNAISLDQAWQVITNGGYNFETNFYPFVLEKKTGIVVAHGTTPLLIGMTLSESVAAVGIGFFNVDLLLGTFVKAADSGGGWVQYFWGKNGNINIKSSYATNITDDYVVAVGYNNEPLPIEENCDASFDSWCSLTNVRSLVGQAQFLMNGAETLNQFEKGKYEMSFNDEYRIKKGFYLFMYHYDGRLMSHAHLHQQFGMRAPDIFANKCLGTWEEGEQLHRNFIRAAEGRNGGWIQYPWRNKPQQKPFTKVAYIIKIVFQGEPYYLGVGFTFRTLAHESDSFAPPSLPNLPTGNIPDQAGDGSLDLPCNGAEAAAVALPIDLSGASVSVHKSGNLSSFSNISDTGDVRLQGSSDVVSVANTCIANYTLPCAFRTSLHLASHAMTHAISSPVSVDEIWRLISVDPFFRANNFYIYAYDFNGTLVAHGAVPSLVGKTMQQIYDEAKIEQDVTFVHNRFKEAAEGGGGWVVYDWRVPGTVDTFKAKIAYLWSISIGSQRFYAGVGFYHKRAPIERYSEKGRKNDGERIPCSSRFDLDCSLNNAKALVGNAAAELTLVSSAIKVRVTEQPSRFKTTDDVLKAITHRDPAFAVNDFYVSVFAVDGKGCPGHNDRSSGCCLAHGGNPQYVNKTWQEILDIENITSIPGFLLHERLAERASASDTPWNYSYSGTIGRAQTKKAIVALVEGDDGGDKYVVAEYFGNPQFDTCDSCPDHTECTEPSQAFCTAKGPPAKRTPYGLLLVVPVVILLSVLFVLWYKRRNWKKRQILAQKIKQMEKQMKDMVEIVHDTGMQVMTAQDYRDKFGHVGLGAGAEQAPPKVHIAWYWKEQQRFISRHHSSRILPGEQFVKYGEASSDQIERAYQRWQEGNGFKEMRLDLTGKINKFDSQASGSTYVIDFEEMTQRNIWSGYSRTICREQHVEAKLDLEVVNRLPPLPVDIDFFGDEGEDFLPTSQGQVIQVSKEHPSEQWLYGSVMYDPLLADAQSSPQGVAATEGLNRVLAMALHDRPTSGWFPAALSRPADVKVMQHLVESLGGEGVTNLKPPGRWKPHMDGCIDVAQGSAEYEEVVHYFLAALYEQRDHVSVVGVQRIQSMPLWQSYAVKKETMRTRDIKYPENMVNNQSGTVERRWLFHGTTGEVIPKIVKQGFNRAFAGRNAVAFGKGVYFARDAAYSSHSSYSTPDSNGIQRMFLCRVAVGDWCKGHHGQLTPNTKPRNQMELFDSTVDDVGDPTIFVVYHDAQAYPDYLVAFRRRDEESE